MRVYDDISTDSEWNDAAQILSNRVKDKLRVARILTGAARILAYIAVPFMLLGVATWGIDYINSPLPLNRIHRKIENNGNSVTYSPQLIAINNLAVQSSEKGGITEQDRKLIVKDIHWLQSHPHEWYYTLTPSLQLNYKNYLARVEYSAGVPYTPSVKRYIEKATKEGKGGLYYSFYEAASFLIAIAMLFGVIGLDKWRTVWLLKHEISDNDMLWRIIPRSLYDKGPLRSMDKD